MATLRFPELDTVSGDRDAKVYTLCLFEPGLLVPTVELLDAGSDAEAIAIAQSRRPSTSKELWEHHRLVTRIRKPDFA